MWWALGAAWISRQGLVVSNYTSWKKEWKMLLVESVYRLHQWHFFEVSPQWEHTWLLMEEKWSVNVNNQRIEELEFKTFTRHQFLRLRFKSSTALYVITLFVTCRKKELKHMSHGDYKLILCGCLSSVMDRKLSRVLIGGINLFCWCIYRLTTAINSPKDCLPIPKWDAWDLWNHHCHTRLIDAFDCSAAASGCPVD